MTKAKKSSVFSRPGFFKHFMQKLFGGLCIAGFALFFEYSENADPIIVGILFLLIYILGVWLIGIFFRLSSLKRNAPTEEEVDAPVLRSLTSEVISKFYMPVTICDIDGRLIWHNHAFTQLFHPGESLNGKYLDQFCTATAEELLSADSYDGLPVGIVADGHIHFHNLASFDRDDPSILRTYHVKGYPIATEGKTYCLSFWNNKQELFDLQKKMEEADCIIGYVFIDNLDELLQYLQEQYRLASAKVEDVLRRWIEGLDGILKEYERNKFLVVFEAKHIPALLESRFSVMDDVREVRVGENNMPVTISMGLTHGAGTLAEKEERAHEALDLALQRGGDQVVYKTEAGVEFYGGRSKSVQKRTKVRSRVVAGEIAGYISSASNVIIMGHRFADHDSIGSCIGMYQLALLCGVRANIVVNAEDPNIRICLDRFQSRADYENIFVSGTAALDLITSETLLIICDVSNPQNFESPDLYRNIKNTIIVDHHRKTGELPYKPLLTYIEPSASSASELVTEMLEQSLPLGTLPDDEADLLLAGILLDTNQFTRNTGVRTFSAALYLRSEGASPADANMLFRTTLKDFTGEAKFASNVTIYRDIIAIACRTDEETTADDRISAAKTANRLLGVDGVMASFVLVQIDDTIHISARSQGNLNVQLILERLNGGGHFDVAGAQMRGQSMQTVLEKLKKAIDAYLAEINPA